MKEGKSMKKNKKIFMIFGISLSILFVVSMFFLVKSCIPIPSYPAQITGGISI